MQSRTTRIPDAVIEGNRNRGRFGNLQYPSSGATHGLYMEFHKYSYEGGAVAGVNQTGSIALPLPTNISDDLNINVGANELGVTGAIMSDILTGTGGNALQQAVGAALEAGKGAGDIVNLISGGDYSGATNALSNQSSYAAYLTKAGVTSLTSGFGDAISATSGTAVNPHATLVFDGVAMKEFNFQWNLSPADAQESNEIHNIIRTLKAKSLPRYQSVGSGSSSLSRGILEYPNTVNLYFVGIDPNKIFRFKKSMIKQVSVDYSPNGNVMIKGNNGSSHAFINLSISFAESEIWTADEFE